MQRISPVVLRIRWYCLIYRDQILQGNTREGGAFLGVSQAPIARGGVSQGPQNFMDLHARVRNSLTQEVHFSADLRVVCLRTTKFGTLTHRTEPSFNAVSLAPCRSCGAPASPNCFSTSFKIRPEKLQRNRTGYKDWKGPFGLRPVCVLMFATLFVLHASMSERNK